jgi:3',5'-cyclic AMP phosphodiesterase CpdA
VRTRILHVSDLHCGAWRARNEPAFGDALGSLVERVAPELVVVTGDLTHLNRRAEHEAAAMLLRGLGTPLLVVPGNHDIPLTPGRLFRPWREFERQWQATEPLYSSPTLYALGLNSVRPWRHQSGAIRNAQLERATGRLREAAPGALRVVALHHQLVGAPWRTARKRPVARRNHVLARLVDSGAELILGGHVHQMAVCERHEFEVVDGDARGVVVSIAPGLGQPRPNRRGEARGLAVYRADEHLLEVETHIWQDGDWRLIAARAFPRGRASLGESVLLGR